MRDRPASTTRARVHALLDGRETIRRDDLATEEPLEIRMTGAGASDAARSVAVTMRTPGADFELAAGFLFSEGVLGPGTVGQITYCTDPELDVEQRYNVVTVTLAAGAPAPELAVLERHFVTSSACGVCGKASLEALRTRGVRPVSDGLQVAAETLYRLPQTLARAQSIFARTGGLHAAGLFEADGRPVAVREDVGRHNAVDKLVGWALLGDLLPLDQLVLAVSGRASYEIMQKAAGAGVPVVCAVSAPSSLAVAVAEEFGITLVGFLRERRCNVYTRRDRICVAGPDG